MNAAFAQAFNRRKLDGLLALYEPEALLRTDGSDATLAGHAQIATALQALLTLPGTMVSVNNFCMEAQGIALLRADWTLRGDNGDVLASGSSAEVVRRQADGSWRYLFDHAVGASLCRVPA